MSTEAKKAAPTCEFYNARTGTFCERDAEYEITNSGRIAGEFAGVVCGEDFRTAGSEEFIIAAIIAGRLKQNDHGGPKPKWQDAQNARSEAPAGGAKYVTVDLTFYANARGGAVHELQYCPQLIVNSQPVVEVTAARANKLRKHDCQGMADAIADGRYKPSKGLAGRRNTKRTRRQRGQNRGR